MSRGVRVCNSKNRSQKPKVFVYNVDGQLKAFDNTMNVMFSEVVNCFPNELRNKVYVVVMV